MKTRTALGVVAPAAGIYLVGFVVPLLAMFFISLKQYSPLTGISKVRSLANYHEILTDRVYLSAFLHSVLLSLLVVVITAALAYPICLYLSSLRGPLRHVLLVGVIAPLLISVVVRTFGWQILLGPNGVIDRITGIRLLYTNTAVVIGLVHLFLAQMVLALLAVLGSIGSDVINAARTLGTSNWRIFWRIVFPLSVPGLISGSVITFGASSGALITPLFLGGPRVSFAASEIYREAMVLFNWPMASALSVGLLAINYIMIHAVESVLRRSTRARPA